MIMTETGDGMERITIRKKQIYLTREAEWVYTVYSGHIFVYLAPLLDKGEKIGRRHLICEAKKGVQIPSFFCEDSILGNWCFAFFAIEEATLTQGISQDTEAVKCRFAEKSGFFISTPEEFEEQVIEQYNINLIKEEGRIFASALEQKQVYQQGRTVAKEEFWKKEGTRDTEKSGSKLYDAAACICGTMGVGIVSYETVREHCTRKFNLHDIGRLSRFVSREVQLEENWYRKDYGPLLMYLRENHQPIACIPQNHRRYKAYDGSAGGCRVVTKQYAQKLELRADMIYRSLPPQKTNWRQLVSFGLKSAGKRDFAYLGILTLVGTLMALLIPFVNQQLYDRFIPMGDSTGWVQICLFVLTCLIGNAQFTLVKNLASFRSMSKMEYAVQNAVYDRLFHLKQSFFRQYDSGDLAQRAMGISEIFQILAKTALNALLGSLFLVLYVWNMCHYAPKQAAVAIFMAAVFLLLAAGLSYIQLRYEEREMEEKGKTAARMYQFLSGISKIRIAGAENQILYEYVKDYSKKCKTAYKNEKRGVAEKTLTTVFLVFISMVIYSVTINSGKAVSTGAFLAFLTAFGAFWKTVVQIAEMFKLAAEVIPLYRRCSPILEAVPEVEEGMQQPGAVTGDIEVNNVTFSYERGGDPVIRDLSFHIKAGEYVGIAGASGCGKSTLLKLLLGIEAPCQGRIFYDGKDMENMNKMELRRKFGVVLQEGQLISGSIYENITITAPNASMARVEAVVEAVGLKEDIEQMPMGLHTRVTEDSGNISGGQKQRMLLARAIIGKPMLLFLDEATSALDNRIQKQICRELEKMNNTRIVIAHRISTIKKCDCIFVMEQGEIVETGNYQTLMEKKGLFYQLAQRQLL